MKLQSAKGVRDFLPSEKIMRDKIVAALKEIFELYGYSPLETPAIEKYDVLSSKYAGGSEILKEIFKLKDQAGRQLALRYDLTVPFSRVIGMNPQLKMPFKRYQIDKVWRDGPVGLGRYREFTQCDVDVVGSSKMLADAEVISIVNDFFKRIGMKVSVKVNNRKLINGILEFVGAKKGKYTEIILILDKLEKIGEDEVSKELRGIGISEDIIIKVMNVISIKGDNKEILDKLKELLKSNDAKEGIKELEELFKYCSYFKIKNVQLEPSLARGLVFYTGTVFETYLEKSKITSSVAAGGRFDKIIGKFLESDKEYPAVGISFGLDRIYDAYVEKIKDIKNTVTEVYIIPVGAESQKESIKVLQKLRNEGIKADIDISERGISKNLSFANSLNIPFVVIIGAKEIKQKKFNLRDMGSGKEKLLKTNDIIKELKKNL